MNSRLKRLWPWAVLFVVVAVTAGSAVALRGLRIEGGTIFLPADHPVEKRIARMEHIFGSSDIMTVMMRQKSGTIFEPSTLSLISRFTKALEAIPGIDKVQSLSNTDFMRGNDGEIVVEKIMSGPVTTAAQAEQVRERALSWDMYRSLLYSPDLRSTQWLITLENARTAGAPESTTVMNNIQRLISRYESPDNHFMLAGETPVKALLVSGITRDLTYLIPLLVIVLLLILLIAFRRVAGVLLPLTTVAVSTVWTIGMMCAFGVPINIMGTAIPLFLVTVGSAYGIHFLSHYFAEETSASDALERTVRKVGLPILLAGVTTIGGFGSLVSANVPAIRDMGIFTAVGVLFALLLTFSYVPAVLEIGRRRREHRPDRNAAAQARAEKREKRANAHAKAGEGRTARVLAAIHDAFAARPVFFVLFVVALVSISVVGIVHIQVGQPTVNFFRAGSPVREAARFADRDFGGTTVMYVMIEKQKDAGADKAASGTAGSSPADGRKTTGTSQKNAASASDAAVTPAATPDAATIAAGFASFGDLSTMAAAKPAAASAGPGKTGNGPYITGPALLNAIDGLEKHLRATYRTDIGSVNSLTTMIRQMNRVMHNGENSYYEIPSDPAKYGLSDTAGLRRLISQYLLLYSGNLGSLIDNVDNPSTLRMAVQLTDGNPSFLKEIKKDILAYSQAHIAPLGFKVETVGLSEEMIAMNDSIMRSQLTSLGLALIFVLITVAFSYRSFRLGLAAIVPIVLSLILNFATMGFLRIPLDIVTAMVASVAIGIGIDYSIHVVSAYVHEYRATGSTREAAHATLSLTGRAIFFNVASVSLGFAVLVFSMFTPLNTMGVLIGVIMLTSSFFSLTLLPVLLARIVPHLDKGKRAVRQGVLVQVTTKEQL